MPAIRIFLRSLVYSNLYIAVCAVLMTWEVQQKFNIQNRTLLIFIFWATLCSYNFHSIVNTIYPSTTFRHEWNTRYKTVLILIFFVSLIAVCAYAWWLRRGYISIAIAGLASFLYSAPNIPRQRFLFLRKIVLEKTIFLAVVWTYVTGLLPMLIEKLPLSAPEYFFLGSRFFLVYAICILFDIKDKEEDSLKGIKSLPILMTDRGIRFIYYLSLSFSITCSVNLYSSGTSTICIIFMVIPSILCMIMYNYAITHSSDLLYYVILDGMMMLSALLLYIYLNSVSFVSL